MASAATFERLRAAGRRLRRRAASWANVPTLIGVLGLLVSVWQVSFGFCGPDTEWPAGVASGLATTSDGYRVVGLRAADRLQVYGPDWRFVRGWNVGVFGKFSGPFLGRNDSVHLDTARGRLRYDLEGRRLSITPLPSGHHSSSLLAWVPGSPWYWFLVNPAACFGLCFLGMGVAFLTDRAEDRARRKR